MSRLTREALFYAPADRRCGGEYLRLCGECCWNFPDGDNLFGGDATACHDALARLAEDERFHLHPFALAAENGSIDLVIDVAGVITGAHIMPKVIPLSGINYTQVRAARLNTLLGSEITAEDRTLLKLDLQG